MTHEQMLTLPQVCEMLQLGPDAVRRAVRTGELPAFKIGGRLRFKPADLETYIEGRRVTPTVRGPRSYGQTVTTAGDVPRSPIAQISYRERARQADLRREDA